MARPRKNDADYFPHDNDMRNNLKVKAVRQRHGLEGYAVWCMLIETLTGSDNFTIEVDELTVEMLAGDYGLSAETLSEMLESFRRLKLINYTENKICAPGLLERMEPLLSDRQRKREWAEKNLAKKDVESHQNGGNSGLKPKEKGFSTSKTPESKVKESKVNNTKVFEMSNGAYAPLDVAAEIETLKADDLCKERFFRQCRLPLDQFADYCEKFLLKIQTETTLHKNRQDLRKHFFSWASIQEEKNRAAKSAGPGPQKNTRAGIVSYDNGRPELKEKQAF